MENSTYQNIMEKINESIEVHEEVIADIKLKRHNLQERALCSHNNLFLKGKPILLCKESSIERDNLIGVRNYDSTFTKEFIANKSNYLERALKN